MAQFIKEADYDYTIKAEIKKVLVGDPGSNKQIIAEDTAIATITEYLGGTYDCAAIFTPNLAPPDARNKHIIKIVLALALYNLYHQTGTRDIPEHRKVDYDDAISWLKDAGRGTIKTTLPVLPEADNPGDFRLNSKPQRVHRW